MTRPNELDFFLKEFDDEQPELVEQALVECIKLAKGQGNWDVEYSGYQVAYVWHWIEGWKKAQRKKTIATAIEEFEKWAKKRKPQIPLSKGMDGDYPAYAHPLAMALFAAFLAGYEI